ncbi:MAG: hypothetical protein R2717_03225 [Schumannella sp.]
MPSEDPLHELGVRPTPDGGRLRVWSASASSVELRVYDDPDPTAASTIMPLDRDEHAVWSAESSALTPGTAYSLRVDGGELDLIDPYARGLIRAPGGDWRGYVQDDAFDWGGVEKPRTRWIALSSTRPTCAG